MNQIISLIGCIAAIIIVSYYELKAEATAKPTCAYIYKVGAKPCDLGK